ncbi:MAG: acetate--CoA ligase [Chitinophagales bacterium]|nr:acetate--CoA ligase [Chitinophagales bacterium]
MNTRIDSMEAYHQAYEKSVRHPEKFWADIANEFTWKTRWNNVLNWDFKSFDVKWFVGATLNITENCLDRHLEKNGDTPAIIWEPNDPNGKGCTLTYRELYHAVCKASNMLKNAGVKKGDRVCIYMPMVPEAAVAMLACARIGAIHSIVFAGFSAQSLADRINDATCKMIITADGVYRGAKALNLKEIVDNALESTTSVETVIVFQNTNAEINMQDGRDVYWHNAIKDCANECAAEPMDAEDMLFILYTSGSTGKPKGVVHTTAGYMVWAAYTFANVFQYNAGDIYWCTADIGWVTGHSYIVYGPLLNGATTLMFEGIPTYPDAGRFWNVIDKHQVNIFYTAPTAIRSLMAQDDEFVTPYSLASLKTLGSVGEPINEEAWNWYHEKIGKRNCGIVDTWWQTETGGVMISPLANITPTKPTYATLPLPGVQPVLVDAEGKIIEGNNVEGNLCIKYPWPGMLRTTYGDHERCRTTYFSTYENLYFTGDGCKRDHDGYYRIIGRVDDVINVSGHRLGTAEVENAINEHIHVIESAVIGYPHEIKGQGIYAYVICDHLPEDEHATRREILEVVSKVIGPIAKPDKIQFVTGLPKTRSGKIMRRILRKVAENDLSNLGDTSTLLDPAVVDAIIEGAKKI